MSGDVLNRPPVHALLADGTTVCIRPVTAADHDRLQGLYEEMSPENLRLRFFSASRRSAGQAADRACAPAHPGYRGLLAERHGQVIGLAEYDTGGTGDEAEMSIAVCDDLHHRGVGTLLVEHLVSAARAEGITAEGQAAARALAHAARRAAWLARPAGTVPDLNGIGTARAHRLTETFLAAHQQGGRLDPHTCADLPACYGIPQLPWEWAETEDDAVITAWRLRGPDGRVVMKAHWPGLLHRSEQHAVHLDLEGDAQVRAAFRDFEARFAGLPTGVMIQPRPARHRTVRRHRPGCGLRPARAVRARRHRNRGTGRPRCPAGPLTDHDAHDLITAPRRAPLLFGAGGAGPVDLAGLEQLLLRLSRMASDLPQLAEVDFNPVLAAPGGITVLDARVRLLPHRPRDPYLRRLR